MKKKREKISGCYSIIWQQREHPKYGPFVKCIQEFVQKFHAYKSSWFTGSSIHTICE